MDPGVKLAADECDRGDDEGPMISRDATGSYVPPDI